MENHVAFHNSLYSLQDFASKESILIVVYITVQRYINYYLKWIMDWYLFQNSAGTGQMAHNGDINHSLRGLVVN